MWCGSPLPRMCHTNTQFLQQPLVGCYTFAYSTLQVDFFNLKNLSYNSVILRFCNASVFANRIRSSACTPCLALQLMCSITMHEILGASEKLQICSTSRSCLLLLRAQLVPGQQRFALWEWFRLFFTGHCCTVAHVLIATLDTLTD